MYVYIVHAFQRERNHVNSLSFLSCTVVCNNCVHVSLMCVNNENFNGISFLHIFSFSKQLDHINFPTSTKVR
jgi:hypothetical protein